MENINLSEDIYPVSALRTQLSELMDKVQKDNRSLLITQNGKGAAVIVGVNQYESIREKIALTEELLRAEIEIKEGHILEHKAAKKKILDALK
jgi:antitoxin YefM